MTDRAAAHARRARAILAIDAGLRALAARGCVVLPRYCDLCGTMDHPPTKGPCRACGLDANRANAMKAPQ